MLSHPALLLLGALLLEPSLAFAQHYAPPRATMQAFGSDAELLRYFKAINRARGVRRADLMQADAAPGAASYAAKDESVTNTQHAGVDEGGIVKLHGNHLVVLRRGRLFTVSVRAGELRPVAAVDAYPPDAEPAEWYDEMLVQGDRVIVIGYSYRRGGTEVSLFSIDGRGGLRHLSTSHLRSNDYYSSRNYAARLVDGKLVFYTPLLLGYGDPLASLPAMREWRPGVEGPGGFERIATPRRIYRPARSLAGSGEVTLHSITRCDVGGTRLECDATVVVGPFSRVFYVSPRAVYVWAAEWPYSGDDDPPEPSSLFRLPLDGSAPSALTVAGAPVDQFSFLESDDGHINVVVQPDGTGDWMWTAEWQRSPGAPALALLRAPLVRFDDGRASAPSAWYRSLPPPATPGVLHNRFIGDHLLYGRGNGWWNDAGDTATVFVLPWKSGEATPLRLPHAVDRIEVMGPDAVVVGSSGGDLHFSGIRLGERPAVVQRFVQEGASQGETRSHGFFYRAEDARPGILGLPVRGPGRPGYEHLVEGSASVVFLRNEGRRFTRLGALSADTLAPVADGCKASCVDWYGNARPLFLKGRILALLGYELVEGSVATGALREVRRASFAPEAPRTTLLD